MYPVDDAARHALIAWQNFYVILGSSAGALIGLQFVVIALIGSLRQRADADSINTFGTPTIVHFSWALAISAGMCAPWRSLLSLSLAVAVGGVVGLVYAANVFRRARRQKFYKPVLEDWIWYAIAPCTIYAVLAGATLVPGIAIQLGLFLIAGAVLALLLVGIHNAWDSVTHIVATAHHSDPQKPIENTSSNADSPN